MLSSKFVANIFKSIGIDLNPKVDDVTPNDIAKSEYLELIIPNESNNCPYNSRTRSLCKEVNELREAIDNTPAPPKKTLRGVTIIDLSIIKPIKSKRQNK